MFDNLSPKKEDEITVGTSEEKPSEAPLGSLGNVPANLVANFDYDSSNQGGGSPSVLGASQPLNEEFDARMEKLETKGKKRGIRFSKIGLIAGFVIALVVMGVGYYLLTDTIGISEKAQESAGNVQNIGRENGNKERASSTQIIMDQTFRTCQVDEDCVTVQESCCSCDKGGEQTGINKLNVSTWQLDINNRCASSTCSTVTQCATGKAYCDAMVCKFKKDPIDCKKQGEAITASSTEAVACCSGLQASFSATTTPSGQCEPNPEQMICINCGDGVCGAGESMCNCPNDCSPTGESTGIIMSGVQEGAIKECIGDACPLNNISTSSPVVTGTTTPNVWQSNPNLTDSDNDGLSNADEAKYGTDPNNPDTDGDGYTDGDEVHKGYNPLGAGMLK